MVVGAPGPDGHHVAVQWPGACQNDDGHVPTHLHLLLDVAATVTRPTNDHVLVFNTFYIFSRKSSFFTGSNKATEAT